MPMTISSFFGFLCPRSWCGRRLTLTGPGGGVLPMVLVLFVLLFLGATARADNCSAGFLPGGGSYLISVPPGWTPQTGQLLVYVPGYQSPDDGVGIPDIDPQELALVNELGIAFAAINYRKTGLAVKQGVEDVGEFLDMFYGDYYGCGYARPAYTYLAGGSMGGLVATLKAEREAASSLPQVDGALALCAPVGDFHSQLNYFLDVRVVFDLLFNRSGQLIPGTAVSIPPHVIANWPVYEQRVIAALYGSSRKTRYLARLARVPVAADTTAARVVSIVAALRYNIGATNDANDTLGGQAYDNSRRVYVGSGSWYIDWYVNRYIKRYMAEAVAVTELRAWYQTSGRLALADQGGSDIPVVTGHNVSDPIVPWWHEPLYAWKANQAGSLDQLTPIPVFRYGHCNFSEQELLGLLALLTKRVSGEYQIDILSLLP